MKCTPKQQIPQIQYFSAQILRVARVASCPRRANQNSWKIVVDFSEVGSPSITHISRIATTPQMMRQYIIGAAFALLVVVASIEARPPKRDPRSSHPLCRKVRPQDQSILWPYLYVSHDPINICRSSTRSHLHPQPHTTVDNVSFLNVAVFTWASLSDR
jgi:hypothetical protein